MRETEFTVFFPFCGLGAGALGFLQARAALLGQEARFRSLGGIDNDPAACADFARLTGSPALCADIATLTPDELRRFAGLVSPDVVFSSPPCKANSALLNRATAETERYQAMNRLVVEWLELVFAAWSEPPRLILIENVPGIQSRGAPLLRKVKRLLRSHGYVTHEGTHDCGELGGLAQHRRRYLLVARQADRVPPLLYQPPKMRVRGCGEVIGLLPMPEDPAAGSMHRMPRLRWLNWIRLALIPAGGDWRDLPGVLAEHQKRREVFGRYRVERWDEPSQCVSGDGTNGPYGVADPRAADLVPEEQPMLPALADNPNRHWNKYCVRGWDQPAPAVIGATRPGSGAPAVADPRVKELVPERDWHRGVLGVKAWNAPSGTVCGENWPGNGAFSVADPRVKRAYDHGYRILRWNEPSFVVHGKSHPGCGAYSVADPRLRRPAHAGAYGVLHWQAPSGTVTGAADVDNGRWAIADPRVPEGPFELVELKRTPDGVPVIIAADGTWHRPLTTLELGCLQGLPALLFGEPLVLDGTNASKWRERIGNAVPVAAAKAIATQMLVTLVHASMNSFALSGDGEVWVDRAEPAWAL